MGFTTMFSLCTMLQSLAISALPCGAGRVAFPKSAESVLAIPVARSDIVGHLEAHEAAHQ